MPRFCCSSTGRRSSDVCLIEPASKTTSYDPIAILKELSPADVQPVYDQLQASIVSITRIGLKELLKIGGS